MHVSIRKGILIFTCSSEGDAEPVVGDTDSGKGSGTNVEDSDEGQVAVWMKFEDFRKAFS